MVTFTYPCPLNEAFTQAESVLRQALCTDLSDEFLNKQIAATAPDGGAILITFSQDFNTKNTRNPLLKIAIEAQSKDLPALSIKALLISALEKQDHSMTEKPADPLESLSEPPTSAKMFLIPLRVKQVLTVLFCVAMVIIIYFSVKPKQADPELQAFLQSEACENFMTIDSDISFLAKAYMANGPEILASDTLMSDVNTHVNNITDKCESIQALSYASDSSIYPIWSEMDSAATAYLDLIEIIQKDLTNADPETCMDLYGVANKHYKKAESLINRY